MGQLFSKIIILGALLGLWALFFVPAVRRPEKELTGDYSQSRRLTVNRVSARNPASSTVYKNNESFNPGVKIVERSQTEPEVIEEPPEPVSRPIQGYIPMENYYQKRTRSFDTTTARKVPAKARTENKINETFLPDFLEEDVLINDPLEKPLETKKSNTLTCSANIGGGTFSSSQTVSLSCSNTGEIKYCVSEGSCCDPTSGLNYTGPISIGASGRQFCLSFIGFTSDGDASVTTEHSYVFNSFAPNMVTEIPTIQYQTTELPGLTSISSGDFFKPDFGIGLINMKSHNPGPDGLNLTCTEIVEEHTDYSGPVPGIVLNFFDTSGVSAASQVQIPLTQNDLVYGENFLTSYILDSTNAQVEYACSTNKVTLTDFEFFNSDIAHAQINASQVAEFSAGFSPYGFFEVEENLYRGPAGKSSEESTGQLLESGLFGVLY